MTWPARHPLTRNLSPVRVKAHLASGISPFLVLRWEVALRAAAHRVVVKIIPIKGVLNFWWFMTRWKVSCQLDDMLRRFHLMSWFDDARWVNFNLRQFYYVLNKTMLSLQTTLRFTSKSTCYSFYNFFLLFISYNETSTKKKLVSYNDLQVLSSWLNTT